MTTEPSAPHRDAHQLDVLSVFHYVLGAMAVLFASLWLVWGAAVWIALAYLAQTSNNPEDMPGEIFAVVPLLGFLVFLPACAFGIPVAAAGRFLAKRAHYRFCLVVAAAECFVTPFGLLLGSATLIVLARNSVKALFEVAAAPVALGPTAPPTQ